MHRIRVGAVCAGLILIAATAALAQIPSMPVGPRFDNIEILWIERVPETPDEVFVSGHSGTLLPVGARAVVARFRALSVPDEGSYRIVWTRGADGPHAPRQASELIPGRRFLDGVTMMFTNRGEPLEGGRYQVAVQGESGKIHRFVQFEVWSKPIPAATTVLTGSFPVLNFEEYRIAGMAFEYPEKYDVEMLGTEGAGVLMRRTNGVGALFVLVEGAEAGAKEKQLVQLRDRIVQKVGGHDAESWRGFALAPIPICGRPATGRLYSARRSETHVRFVVHEVQVGERRLLTGYLSETPANPREIVPEVEGEIFEVQAAYKRLTATMRYDD